MENFITLTFRKLETVYTTKKYFKEEKSPDIYDPTFNIFLSVGEILLQAKRTVQRISMAFVVKNERNRVSKESRFVEVEL